MHRHILLFCALLTACPTSQDCAPHAQVCVNDTPRLCSSTGHGYAESGMPLVRCAETGAVCVVRDGLANCAHADAGAGDER